MAAQQIRVPAALILALCAASGRAWDVVPPGTTGLPQAPPCRKSPDVHALWMPGTTTSQSLFAFAGKGWVWQAKQDKNDPHGEADIKQHVELMGDMWHFSLASKSWSRIMFDEGFAPLHLWKTGSASVNSQGNVALFGGCTDTDPRFVLNDLWVFTPDSSTSGTWQKLQSENSPPKRRGHVLVANDSHLVVFGGKTWTDEDGASCINDLWAIPKTVLTQSSDSWTQGSGIPGGCRWGGTGDVLDNAGTKYLAYFGGRNLNLEKKNSAQSYTYYNDLWLYEFEQDRWFLAPAPGPKPAARDHHGMTSINGDLYIFGGRTAADRSAAQAVISDVWSYSLRDGHWTFHEPRGASPSPRFMPGVTSVQHEGQPYLAIFGGEVLPGSTKLTTMNDVWLFDPRGNKWEQVWDSDCGQEPQLGGDEIWKLKERDVAQKFAYLLSSPVFVAASAAAVVLGGFGLMYLVKGSKGGYASEPLLANEPARP